MKQKLLFILVLGVLILTACGGNGSNQAPATLEPVPSDYAGKTNPLGADAAADGAKIFKVNCEPCHGPQGHGDGAAGQVLDPKPKNLAEFQAVASDDYLFWRISSGRPGTSMAPWKGILTDEQIWQAITFIHTLK